MALTPATVFGKLEMEYSAYGHDHVFRCWVPEFGVDAGLGTFASPATPFGLSELATELSSVIKPLYNSDSSLAFGAWTGLKVTNPTTGACIPIVEGTITPGSASFDTTPNAGQAVSQSTWAFRDSDGKLLRLVNIGSIYVGPVPFKYSSLGGGYLAFANYVLASVRIKSKGNLAPLSMIDVTFDTNDGLTRRYRR